MKTIKKSEIIKRVSDREAIRFVKYEDWNYCPKSEWKNRNSKKALVAKEQPNEA